MLVFLDRLERDADTRTQFLLANAGQEACLTKAPSDMHIDRIGPVLANRTTPTGGTWSVCLALPFERAHAKLPPSIDHLIIAILL
jgi:hypothetical protein